VFVRCCSERHNAHARQCTLESDQQHPPNSIRRVEVTHPRLRRSALFASRAHLVASLSAGIRKVSIPPYFGVSPAIAAAGAAAPSIAANVAALNATLASRYLFIEPYRRQVLIQIMTSQARCQHTPAAGPWKCFIPRCAVSRGWLTSWRCGDRREVVNWHFCLVLRFPRSMRSSPGCRAASCFGHSVLPSLEIRNRERHGRFVASHYLIFRKQFRSRSRARGRTRTPNRIHSVLPDLSV
jgi:hypothetical protein